MADLDILLTELREIKEKISSMPAAIAAPTPEIITGDELCKRLNISEPTLIKWRRKKKIPVIALGQTYRYNWPAVVSSLENMKSKN
jgi:excisionase family DNA binding protein